MATTPTSAAATEPLQSRIERVVHGGGPGPARGHGPSRLPAARGSTSSRRQRGFTLLEVIIVMVIVGVIAAMAIPQVQSGLRQSAVRRSVRAFISAARQASSRAVTTRKTVSLILYPDDGAFAVEGTGARVELPDFAEFGEIRGGREAEADDEIRFDFYPTGSSSGGSIEIEFNPRDRRQSYELVIDPLISRVRIEDHSS